MQLIPNRRHDRILVRPDSQEGPYETNDLIKHFHARPTQPGRPPGDTLYSVPLGKYKTKAPLVAAIRRHGITLINAPRQHGARR